MEIKKLMQAVQELLAARSQDETGAVLMRYPELLDESSVNTLLDVAEAARDVGEAETAKMLAKVAEFLLDASQGDGEQASSDEEAIAFEPVTPETSVPWVRLTRQYLALRREEYLEQAITDVQRSREIEIVALLRARQEQDLGKIDRIAPHLYRNFIAAGRNEEGATIALIGLDLRAVLAESFVNYSLDLQATVLEAGLQACQEAAAFAKVLGDEACQAFYKRMAGTGYAKWRRLVEAEKAFQEALKFYRKLAAQQPEVYEPDVATTLNNLGTVLWSDLRLEQAEQAFEEASELYYKLAMHQPQVYESKVATALNNLGAVLSGQRRLEQAEQAYQEALTLYRKLCAQQPHVYKSYVAGTLTNLGIVLSDQRQLEQAERAYQEALKIRRELAVQQQPQVYQPDLANILFNFGTTLTDQRQLEQAEQAFQEALGLYRKLAAQQPQVYESYLAATLNSLGVVLWNQQRLEQSEQAYREALEIRRRLVVKQPQVYEPDVAMTLNNLGVVLSDQRQLEQAEQAYQEALTLNRKLCAQQPQVYELEVAMTLNNVGNILREQRLLEQAERAHRESLELYRKLAAQQPQVYQPDLATSLNSLGTVLSDQRRLEQAEQFFQEALEIHRKLAAQQPQVYESVVALTLNNLATALFDQRRLDQAERAHQESLELYRKLAAKQPQIYERDVAMTLNNLGNVLSGQRRLVQAEQAHREALEIRRKLVAQQPLVYQPEVAMTLNNLGAVLQKQRQWEQAEQAYEEALEIRRQLTKQQPQVYESDVAGTLDNLGIVLQDRQRLEQAERLHQEALAIRRKLAAQQPQVYEPDVAMTLNNLGTVLWRQQRLEQAKQFYQEALELNRKLAAQQPLVYEPSVAGTLSNLGVVLSGQESEQAFQEALMLCRRHDVPVERSRVLSRIGQIQMEQTRWDEAAETLNEAVEQVERLRTETLNLDRRMQILRDNIGAYEYLLICLMKLGRFQEALEVAERSKSRTLIDLLTLRDLRPKNAPPELADEYERMLFRARALEDRLLQRGEVQATGMGDPPPEERIRQQQEQIKVMQEERLRTNLRLQELVDEIRRHDPDFLPHAKPLNLAEIKTLAQDTQATLMLFLVTEAGSFTFLAFPDGETDVVQVPEFTTKALNQMLVKFEDGRMSGRLDEAVDGWVVRYYGFQAAMHQAQQTKKEEDQETANQAWQAWLNTMEDTLGTLYQRLLDPVHQRLKERERKSGERIERVVMVPNRGLAILPLHACWWEEDGKRRYLLDDYVITYAPSLSVFKRCLERERAGRSKQTMLGIANPKPPGNLVFSEWECEEIERLLGDERCLFLWGEQATKAEMMKWIGERHWLHFSCHGQYRLDAPLESSLSLAQRDELTLGEILEKLDLQHTWLTVLSACETGLVDFREIADEHYGLPLGFLFAGAPTVWGTLWTVNDLTTALLMREAYQNLIGNDGASKPESLREAQRWLRDAKAEELLALVSSKQATLGYHRMAWYDLSPFRRSIQHRYDPQACPYSHPYFWAGMQCVGA